MRSIAAGGRSRDGSKRLGLGGLISEGLLGSDAEIHGAWLFLSCVQLSCNGTTGGGVKR